jgi:two-component system chemotaxis sensor kinase CheA
MYYIDDDELRELYKNSTAEHLDRAERLILSLEKNPADAEALDVLLRELHAFKGDSHMLGVVKAKQLSHELEDVFTKLKKKSIDSSPELFSVALETIDALREIASEAVTGVASRVSVTEISVKLARVAQTHNAAEVQASTPIMMPSESELDKQDREELDESIDIESVRIPLRKLEQLTHCTTELQSIYRQLSKKLELVSDLITHLVDVKEDSYGVTEIENEVASLQKLNQFIKDDISALHSISENLEEHVQELQLLPLDTVFKLYPRLVRDIAEEQGKLVHFVVKGSHELVDRIYLECLKVPLAQLLKNAVDHGIEKPEERALKGKDIEATLTLSGAIEKEQLIIQVSDDGRGIDREKVIHKAIELGYLTREEAASVDDKKLYGYLFLPGFSTKEETPQVSGRGVGLDIVRTTIEQRGGTVAVESDGVNGTVFTIKFPLKKVLSSLFVTQIDGLYYGLTVANFETIIYIKSADIIKSDDDRLYYLWNNERVNIIHLADIIVRRQHDLDEKCICLLYRYGVNYYGFIVSTSLEYQEYQGIKQGIFLGDNGIVMGVTTTTQGETCYVLNLEGIVKNKGGFSATGKVVAPAVEQGGRYRLLLVEDSMPIGTQLKRILERNKFIVTWAKNGEEGYREFMDGYYDCVLTDIEMPVWDGYELIKRIRSHDTKIPIAVLSTLGNNQESIDYAKILGANLFLSKANFDERQFLDCMGGLLS